MKFLLATIASLALAASAVETGVCCPYIDSACKLTPPVEAACKPFTFNKCEKAPSTFVNYYFTTTLNGDSVEYRRFNASDCNPASLEPKWNADGKLGACLGPIDKQMGFDAFIVVTKGNGNSSSGPSTTTVATATSGSVAPIPTTSSATVATTTAPGSAAHAVAPSAIFGFVTVMLATLF